MKKKQKHMIWIVLGVAVLVALGLFSGDGDEDKKIKVGVLLPIGGEFADWGVPLQRGIESAAHSEIEFVFEDTKCASADAVNGFRKLSEIDGIQFFLGPGCGSPQEAVAPLVKEKDVIAIIPVAATEDIFEKSGGKMYQMQYALEDESAFIANLLESEGHESVALVTYQNAFSQTHAQSFRDNFDGEIREFTFLNTGDDLYTPVTQIREMNPDALFVTDIGFFVANGKDRLDTLGVDAPVYSQYATELPAIRTLVEGVTYSFPGDIDDERGGEYNLAKQSAELLIEKIRLCAGDYHCVLREVANSESFDDRGISTRPFVIKQIQNGEGVVLE